MSKGVSVWRRAEGQNEAGEAKRSNFTEGLEFKRGSVDLILKAVGSHGRVEARA